MPLIIANSKDHKDTYFDTRGKILSQEMSLCNINIYFLEAMTHVNFKKEYCQMSRSKGYVTTERSYMYHKEYSFEIKALALTV